MKLILIVGPPAVGKMTVGQQLAQKLDYKLFHNHASIELALSLFWHGSEEFNAVNEGIRKLVFETAARSKQLKGLIFTLVWAFDVQEDWDYVRSLKELFSANGWEFIIVELYAPLQQRLQRNDTPNRLAHKSSKRNLEASARGMHQMEAQFKLSTDGEGISEEKYLWIDNSDLSAEDTARRIIQHFRLQDTDQ